jgi:hypothetical protein
MDKRIIVFLMVLVPAIGFTQINSDLNTPSFSNLNTEFDMSLGSSVMAAGGGGSAFMNYAFPKLRISPNDKLDLQTGVLMMNTSLSGMQPYGMPAQGGQNALSSNFTDSYAFAGGTYEVNENLVIRGSAFKKFNMNSQMQDVHPQAFNFDAHGMNVGFEYKLSDDASIGASFHYQKGGNPMNNNYRNTYYNRYSPFGHTSPFAPAPF